MFIIPTAKQTTCLISQLTTNTGKDTDADLDFQVHKGFTIGKGTTLYFMLMKHASGNFTAYSISKCSPRWIPADQPVTIHFN